MDSGYLERSGFVCLWRMNQKPTVKVTETFLLALLLADSVLTGCFGFPGLYKWASSSYYEWLQFFAWGNVAHKILWSKKIKQYKNQLVWILLTWNQMLCLSYDFSGLVLSMDVLRPDQETLYPLIQGFCNRDPTDGKENRKQGISPF